jgi:sec-independent protein translocase protein TatC
MATAIRTIGHEDRLSLVEHLTELRARLIISLATLAIAFGVCFWQNHALLHFINRPLQHQTQKSIRAGHGPLGQTAITQQAVLAQNRILERELAIIATQGSGLHGTARAQLAALQQQFQEAVKRVPRTPVGDKPTTLGIGEPFTQTLTISFYFALLFSLPVILWQLYGFLLPAFTPSERRVATPLLVSIPALFAAGAAFGYLVVLPAAVRFFQNFNSGEFNILVQASPYYHFALIVMLLMGIVFQVPVAIVGATRAGIVTVAQLRKGRRFAIVVAAVVAALLPADLITMILEMAPLVLLYGLGILLAALFERRDRRRAAAVAMTPAPATSPSAPSSDQPSDDAV